MKDKGDSVPEMDVRKQRLRALFARTVSVRDVVVREAGDWWVANREGLDARQRAAFAAWLRTSPLHVEEYLSIAELGGELDEAAKDPELSLDELMKRAAETDDPGSDLDWLESAGPLSSVLGAERATKNSFWQRPPWMLGAAAVALGLVVVALLFWRGIGFTALDHRVIAYNLQTRHGELLTRRLPDGSEMELDTDTSVSVRFDRTQRVVRIISGRVEFKVAHEPERKFLVQARDVGITDVGTEFEVYARPESTLVTVFEGRVAVEAKPPDESVRSARLSSGNASVEVAAGQQVRIEDGSWPPMHVSFDAQRATAWLRRQIVVENEPLERVAAEFSRYSTIPIEIDSPALRALAVSGVFAADDTDSFVAFLRSLDGVQVDVTAVRIRVFRK